MTSTPWRISSRLIVLMALSWPSQMGTAVRTLIGSLARGISGSGFVGICAPDHYHAGGDRAAHVEGEVSPRAGDLALPRRAGEVGVRLGHLPDARRANRMAVAHQAPAGVDGNRTGWLARPQRLPGLRQDRCAALQQRRPAPALGKTEYLVGEDLRDREAVV